MKLDEKDKQRNQEEYALLLSLFHKLLELAENSTEYWETIDDIISSRTAFLFDRVLEGLSLDFNKALGLLRNNNNFISELERQQRDILVAAIDNLVDFAAGEEQRMLDEVAAIDKSDDLEKDKTFEKYNLTYAIQENEEVKYAAKISAWWLLVPTETLITFMTQGDERVRPWHLSLEGLSYIKSEFPSELIPPIEWGCRCFLISDGFSSVMGAIKKEELKKHTNPIFSDSLAKGGKIFSNAHPYFQKALHPNIEKIAIRIKAKFYEEANN